MVYSVFLLISGENSANEIACDEDECSDEPCCLLTESAIDGSDFIISGQEDEAVRLFDSSRNRNVKFLPIRVGDKFPGLVSYVADRCRIQEISKFNFENLFHLRTLNLDRNRLQAVTTDTFTDLISLEILLLGNFFID